MAYLESGIFCSASEYENGLAGRVNDAELERDEIYTLVMRLDSEKREASKMAVRTIEVNQKLGLAVVKLAFLNEELEPTREAQETVADGLIHKLSNTVIVEIQTQAQYAITQAYFKDYFEDQFGDYMTRSGELSLTA